MEKHKISNLTTSTRAHSMNIAKVTLAARARRPDLKMLGTAVQGGKFSIVHFPTMGKTSRPEPVYLAENLTLPEAIQKLESL